MCVFAGAIAVFIGNCLRYIPPVWGSAEIIAPLFEIGGGALFIGAYLGVAFISLRPAHFAPSYSVRFTRAAFQCLSRANDDDYISIFRDISINIVPIAKLAAFNESYRWSGCDGDEPSAFYDFIYRHRIDRSYYAGTLFRLLSDPSCCAAIVRRDPTTVINMLRQISKHRLDGDALGQLIQELARQSLIQNDSMLAREIGYKGFASIGAFLTAMFGDAFILRQHEPYRGVQFLSEVEIDSAFAERLGRAIELSWLTVNEVWSPQSLWGVQYTLESALFKIRYADSRKEPHDQQSIRLYRTVAQIIEQSNIHIKNHPIEYRRKLYADDGEVSPRQTLPALTASIAVEALSSVANDFKGYEDRRWSDARAIFSALFPSGDVNVLGLSPVQQNAALLIQKQLKQNIEGYFPTLIKVLLAIVGPYGSHNSVEGGAFRIMEDVMYGELKNLQFLYQNNPNHLSKCLPFNVVYDSGSDQLTHTYRFGSKRTTDLKALSFENLDLTDPRLRSEI